MNKIGILGGSFNPIHLAHLVLAETARETLRLNRVVFVPAKLPPHKDPSALADAKDRLAMVRLAVAGNPSFEVSDIELRREGPSYTVDTVEMMRRRSRWKTEVFFLIGADTLRELPAWREIRRLAKLCKFVPLSRPGAPAPDVKELAEVMGAREARAIIARAIEMPLLDISSSDIRRRVANGKSIRYLVPEAVARYIERKAPYCSGV